MNCPRCHTPCTHQDDECTVCGFSAELVRSYLGDHWIKLERITDPGHCLRLEDLRECEMEMADFERVFPQAFVAAYFGMLPAGLSVGELGFWLLNQSAFNTHQIQKRNDFGIVMVVDPMSKSLAITLGYAIEEWFVEPVMSTLLQAIVNCLKAQDYRGAISCVIEQTAHELRKHARRQPWSLETAGEALSLVLLPLRGGHRPAQSRPIHQ